MKSYRALLAAGVATTALSFGCEALAQTQGASADGGQLAEVIVTARKREEKLLDIPISASVVSARDIEQRGLVNSADYLRGVPGVNQVEGFQGQAIVMRGIETSPANQTFTTGATTVATYFGETPTSNSAGLAGGSAVDIQLVDIERVEVLRGPQGTAFGSSSMGGTVRTIPVAPRLGEFGGSITAGYSVTADPGDDNHLVRAVGNLPLGERAALRLVGYTSTDSGFYKNRAGSDPSFQAIAARYGARSSATDAENLGEYRVRGFRAALLFQPTDDLRITLSHLDQRSERDGVALVTSAGYTQTLFQVAPSQVKRGQLGGYSDTRIKLSNATLEYDLGNGDIVATVSHTAGGWEHATPFGAVGGNYPLSYSGPTPHKEDAAELRYASRFEGPINVLVGVYAERMKDSIHYDYLWHGDPALRSLVFAAAPLTPTLVAVYNDNRKQNQKAAFGELSWDITPQVTATVGARHYQYERTIRLDNDGAAFYGPTGQHRTDKSDASGTIYRGNLSYKPTERSLLYATFSQGFRLGRPQAGIPQCDRNADGIVDGTDITVASTQKVQSDSIDNYEAGGKYESGRMTISAALFRMRWKNVPVRFVAGTLQTGCGLGYTANAGSAVSDGVELQASFQVARPLRLDVGGSYTDARLTEDVPAIGARKGGQLPGAPDLTLNASLQYAFEVRGRTGFVRADTIYVGPFYGDLQQTGKLKSGDYVKLDAAAQIDFERFSVTLFANNLTNEDAFTFRGTSSGVGAFYGYQLRPRTIGARIEAKF